MLTAKYINVKWGIEQTKNYKAELKIRLIVMELQGLLMVTKFSHRQLIQTRYYENTRHKPKRNAIPQSN